MAESPIARMPETGRPRDLRQHCSICYFHFWQRRKIFYLGRHQDLVNSSKSIMSRFDVIPARRDEFLFLGEHYLFTFDRSGWRPLPRQNGAMQHVSLPVIGGSNEAAAAASSKSWPLFPVCWDCFRVIREFLTFRNERPRQEPSITSLGRLYRVLHAQWSQAESDPAGNAGEEKPNWCLDWPHGSYRGPFQAYDRFARSHLLAETATAESMDKWTWLMGDPYRPLASLAEFLVRHLQPVEDPPAADDVLAVVPRRRQPDSTLLRMPQEVISQITSYLDANSCFAMRLTCAQLAAAVPLDQWFWYEKFMTHGLFGFFFDFDIIKVIEEARTKCKKRGRMPPHWDWRRLARELALFSSFQNGGAMDDAPDAFRNRRRIWKILEMAEIYHRDVVADSFDEQIAVTAGFPPRLQR